MATKQDYVDLISKLETEADNATTANNASRDSFDARASRAAASLVDVLGSDDAPDVDAITEDVDVNGLAYVTAFLDAIKAAGPQAFDRSTGDALASSVGGLLAIDPTYAPDVFNGLRDSAKAAFDKWHASVPRGGGRKTTRTASNGGASDGNGALADNGVARVDISMTLPDGTTRDASPASKWSNVGYAITSVLKDVSGETMRDLSDADRDGWNTARDAIRGGTMGPHSFTLHSSNGDIAVTMTGRPLAGSVAPTTDETTDETATEEAAA